MTDRTVPPGKPRPQFSDGSHPEIGQHIRDWELVQYIGEGAFAEVWQGKWASQYPQRTGFPDRVAVKILVSADGTDVVEEARTGMSIEHPNLVRTVEAFVHESVPVLITELADSSLADHLERRGPLSPSELHEFIDDSLAGLAALHCEGVSHLDLTPANLLRTGARWKIADFGIAATPRPRRTRGNEAIQPPEAIVDHSVKPNSAWDVWAFGILVHKAATGDDPRQRSGEQRPAGSIRIAASIDPSAQALINWCLQDRSSRPSDAHALISIWEDALPFNAASPAKAPEVGGHDRGATTHYPPAIDSVTLVDVETTQLKSPAVDTITNHSLAAVASDTGYSQEQLAEIGAKHQLDLPEDVREGLTSRQLDALYAAVIDELDPDARVFDKSDIRKHLVDDQWQQLKQSETSRQTINNIRISTTGGRFSIDQVKKAELVWSRLIGQTVSYSLNQVPSRAVGSLANMAGILLSDPSRPTVVQAIRLRVWAKEHAYERTLTSHNLAEWFDTSVSDIERQRGRQDLPTAGIPFNLVNVQALELKKRFHFYNLLMFGEVSLLFCLLPVFTIAISGFDDPDSYTPRGIGWYLIIYSAAIATVWTAAGAWFRWILRRHRAIAFALAASAAGVGAGASMLLGKGL